MVHAMDINGARRRSHEPTAARQEPELGLGWPESTHRWTMTTCRAASLNCSEGSKERVSRVWLERVEGEGSRRTGRSRTTNRWSATAAVVVHRRMRRRPAQMNCD